MTFTWHAFTCRSLLKRTLIYRGNPRRFNPLASDLYFFYDTSRSLSWHVIGPPSLNKHKPTKIREIERHILPYNGSGTEREIENERWTEKEWYLCIEKAIIEIMKLTSNTESKNVGYSFDLNDEYTNQYSICCTNMKCFIPLICIYCFFLVIFLFYNQNLQYGFSDFYCKKLTNKQCTPNPLGNNCWMRVTLKVRNIHLFTYHGHWFIRESTFGGYRLNLLVKVYR